MDVIVIHGAPGCGKTTAAALLHARLKSPWFEFGWIPEFTRRNLHTEISGAEEERLSFENLMLVTRNYLRHGFENVILSDLSDARIPDIARELCGVPHIIVTLFAEDGDLLRRRILARTGENTYKDWRQAQRINEGIAARPLLPNEVRVCVDDLKAEEIAAKIAALAEEGPQWAALDKEEHYAYQPATPAQLERRWDINITNNPGDPRWVAWRTQLIEDNRAGLCKTFVMLCGEEPVGEGTLLFSPDPEEAEVNALRMDKAHAGKGHMSHLVRIMESHAAARGIRRLTIGVDAREARNLAIYLHWGYRTFIRHAFEDGELVLYYGKTL